MKIFVKKKHLISPGLSADYEYTIAQNTSVFCKSEKKTCARPIQGDIRKLVRVMEVYIYERQLTNDERTPIVESGVREKLNAFFKKEMLQMINKDESGIAAPLCKECRYEALACHPVRMLFTK